MSPAGAGCLCVQPMAVAGLLGALYFATGKGGAAIYVHGGPRGGEKEGGFGLLGAG